MKKLMNLGLVFVFVLSTSSIFAQYTQPGHFVVNANISGVEADGTPMTCTFTLYDSNGSVIDTEIVTKNYYGEGDYVFKITEQSCFEWSFELYGRNDQNIIPNYYLSYTSINYSSSYKNAYIETSWHKHALSGE